MISLQQVVLDDVRKDDITRMTDEEKSHKSDELIHRLRDLEGGLSDEKSFLHKMALGNQREFFTEWAIELEQLFYLGKFTALEKYEEPIRQISTYIRSRIGKMNLPLEKKENLYNNLDRNLDSKFKHTNKNQNPQNEDNNTSYISDADFMRRSLIRFEEVLRKQADLVENLHTHLMNPKIHSDFLNVIEWREIALFCDATATLLNPRKTPGILEQIEGEQNIRELATIIQRSYQVLLRAFASYRKFAHKFGISPRQNQHIRTRDKDWPPKEAAKVIANVYTSYQCVNCGFNPVTHRVNDDVKMMDDKYWLKIKMGNKPVPVPKKFKEAKLNPIEIAEQIWGRKIPVEIPDAEDLKKMK